MDKLNTFSCSCFDCQKIIKTKLEKYLPLLDEEGNHDTFNGKFMYKQVCNKCYKQSNKLTK